MKVIIMVLLSVLYCFADGEQQQREYVNPQVVSADGSSRATAVKAAYDKVFCSDEKKVLFIHTNKDGIIYCTEATNQSTGYNIHTCSIFYTCN